MKSKQEKEIHIHYHRAGFASKAGHQVRSAMEAAVCDWLMTHGVAHRHMSEVFTVRTGVSCAPTVYVPDIILHDKHPSGKTIIIEPFDAYTPKAGNTRIVASFRKEMKKDFFIIVVAKKQQRAKVLKDAYDMLMDFDNLDGLQKEIPQRRRD